ncbi:DUF1304 domain-containing protein [Streptomyces griseobrunneus]|uniref:DUF1304 domain-containing protein n=1 Tax=Streptomyces microflavus TaxID=1919 RepID=UPI0037FBC9D6
MHTAAQVLVALVALIHVYFLVLEMFLWDTDRGRTAFGTTAEFSRESATLAANQGLYNGFMAAGLIWSLLAADPVSYQAQIFFLSCLVVAGVYGAVTVSRKILFVQAVPSALALGAVLLAG